MAKFRTQNREAMKARADAARQHEARRGSGGGGGDAAWHKLEFGVTVLRILPPFSDRGVIVHEFYEHGWLPPTTTQGPSRGRGNSRRAMCLGKSFPDRDATCAICAHLDAAEKKHRGIGKGLWAGRKCHINALVIKHTDPQGNVTISDGRSAEEGRYQPFIVQIPGGVANWIEIQQDANDMDFADPSGGVNVIITKSKTGPEAYEVDYKCTTDPRGPSEMAPQAMWDDIAGAMKNLDVIYGWPKDEKLGEIAQTAEIVAGYLAHKAGKTPAGASGGSWKDGANAPSAESTAKAADDVTKAYGDAASTGATTPTGSMAPPKSLADAQKTTHPDCYAGAREHTGSEDEDFKGAKGYQAEYTKCIICPSEMACQSASAEAGLVQIGG